MVEGGVGTGVRGAAAEEAIAIHFKWVALLGGAVGARRGEGWGERHHNGLLGGTVSEGCHSRCHNRCHGGCFACVFL